MAVAGLSASVDLLESVSAACDNFDSLKYAAGVLRNGANGLLFVGSVLSIAEAFLPDEKHEAIMREFTKLHERVDQVRDDIKFLEKTVEWESTELSYTESVSRIEQAMLFVSKMTEARKESDQDKMEYYQDKLKGLDTHELLRVVDDLHDGVIGQGGFGSKPILSRIYSKTGGDRVKLRKLSGRLLQLLTGGITSLMVVESMIDENGPLYVKDLYEDKLKEAAKAIGEILDRCMKEAKSNMQADLERIVADRSDSSNTKIVSALYGALNEKYDWLLFHCMVYDDIVGYSKHKFTGSRVYKLHFHGKCAIAFYTEKKTFQQAESIKQVESMISDAQYTTYTYTSWWSTKTGKKAVTRADTAFDKLKDKLNKADIKWWGIATIKRYVDLRAKYNAGDRVIWILGKRFTFCVLLH